MIITIYLTMNYGANLLFSKVNIHIKRNDRYGLVGANSTGKSTFLKF